MKSVNKCFIKPIMTIMQNLSNGRLSNIKARYYMKQYLTKYSLYIVLYGRFQGNNNFQFLEYLAYFS